MPWEDACSVLFVVCNQFSACVATSMGGSLCGRCVVLCCCLIWSVLCCEVVWSPMSPYYADTTTAQVEHMSASILRMPF